MHAVPRNDSTDMRCMYVMFNFRRLQGDADGRYYHDAASVACERSLLYNIYSLHACDLQEWKGMCNAHVVLV